MTPTGRSLLERLTTREREVLSLICTGITDPEIADRLGISTQVVKNHTSHIRLKTRRRNRTDLAIFAFYHGIVACPCKAAEVAHKWIDPDEYLDDPQVRKLGRLPRDLEREWRDQDEQKGKDDDRSSSRDSAD